MGKSASTARRAVRKLQDAGLVLIIARNRVDGKKVCNAFWILSGKHGRCRLGDRVRLPPPVARRVVKGTGQSLPKGYTLEVEYIPPPSDGEKQPGATYNAYRVPVDGLREITPEDEGGVGGTDAHGKVPPMHPTPKGGKTGDSAPKSPSDGDEDGNAREKTNQGVGGTHATSLNTDKKKDKERGARAMSELVEDFQSDLDANQRGDGADSAPPELDESESEDDPVAERFEALVKAWRNTSAAPPLRQQTEQTLYEWAKRGAIDDVCLFSRVLQKDATGCTGRLNLGVLLEKYRQERDRYREKQQRRAENGRCHVRDPGPDDLMTYAEMLEVWKQRGRSTPIEEMFEPVDQPEGKPLWKLREP
jgi:hypothetical protein